MRPEPVNFIVPLIVFPFDIMISLGQNENELKKSLGKYQMKYTEEMKCVGMGKFIISDTNQSIVRLHNFPETPEEYGTLQHEIFHAATYICHQMGMKFKLGVNDETVAYIIGYVTRVVYEKLHKK